MAKRSYNGGELICEALENLGVEHVFGIPGTQNISFFEALRRSHVRTVLASHEAGAGFMANGYFRASGRVGVFTTIGGPGFTNALTPLAEARDDSAAVLYIVKAPPEGIQRFRLQALDQVTIAGSIVKAVFTVCTPDHAERIIREAHETALAGEPGPVMVQVTSAALTGCVDAASTYRERAVDKKRTTATLDRSKLNSIVALLRSAQLPVIYAGQGCNAASDKLIRLAESIQAPVIMTRSGRGVVPMDHPLSLAFDYNGNGADGCNAALAAADLILVLGCKLGHNGTAGFRIHFPPEKTVHVDACAEVLGANDEASVALQADVATVLSVLLDKRAEFETSDRAWTDAELEKWRTSQSAEWGEALAEPKFSTVPGGTAKNLFEALRRILPRDAIVVTDSGLHQVLTFRYWRSLCPTGIIAPSDFQSMGFGLPAAIGAKLACPDREVIAIIGDGGLAMSGMELMTAVREGLQIGVILFNDGALGQIRFQQLSAYGKAHATTLGHPDFAGLAQAMGANHCRLEGPPEMTLRKALAGRGVKVIEVPVEDSAAVHIARIKGVTRRAATAVGAKDALRWLKSHFNR